MRVLFLEIDTERSWALASFGPGLLAAFLRAHGHEVHFRRVGLDTGPDEVAAQVAALGPDLIGVSLGGLLGLRYLQRFDDHQRVERFVTIGTPFRGSRAARAASVLLGRISPAAHQLMPGSDFIQNLNREGLPSRVEALSICATRDALAPPDACTLPGARNVELLGPLPPMTHQALVVSGEVSKLVVEFLDGAESLRDLGYDPEDQAAFA